MKVKCFNCDEVIEADNLEVLAYAFVTHGQEKHSWEYPEEAIRNYACNYAEAVERLTGDTERKEEIGEITIHPVTEDSIDDWLQFFDHDGFADNPGWASCYCLQPHLPTIDENLDRPWRESRSIMVKRLLEGVTFGYLAYVDDKPVGWVNASLRSDYELFRQVDPDGPKSSSVIGISCFVVAPPYRRHGVASALLDHVIEDASTRGALWIEGYPRNQPENTDAGHFTGSQSMYAKRGFKSVLIRERDTVMRLRVHH
ncbi:MAG: GNAT family N-acetyltransferase [Candidatus Thorarchaeota archaeon]|nr:GNAT family N-acetyltransferase [Candidatus Thorarchaeota archaeon]